MKRIYLLRHAKAEWDGERPTDRDRRLSREGREEALAMGERMRKRAFFPEETICSTARRARETLEIIRSALPLSEPIFDPVLYEGRWPDFLPLLKETDKAAGSVLLVGHNPGISALFHRLAKEEQKTSCRDFQTCSLGVLSADIEQWSDLAFHDCDVLFFLRTDGP